MAATAEGPSAYATKDELEWLAMGPFDGGIPGLVRRVRRILDVSQRGLAALIDVSQSAVARWETGRTSPRASVLHHLLRMARLHVTFHDDETGEEVGPMRDDGARKHGGSRFPAHTDLQATGWWVPSGVMSTMAEFYSWRDRSRARRDPMIRFRTCPHVRRLERLMFGKPDDHPALHQLAAEAEHLDELREERRLRARVEMRRDGPGPGSRTSLTA
jgi:HTH-type transcriptional regulator/antitoxin HipB